VASDATAVGGVRGRTRLEPWLAQYVLFGALIVACFSVFVLDAVDAVANNRVFIGTDGTWAYDQLQYLGWTTDAAHHGLIANLFAFHLGSHVFLHPLWVIVGVLHVSVGLSYPLLIAFWQGVALVALFFAVRAYARSLLGSDGWRVTIGVLLAMFMLPASFLIANKLGFQGAKEVNFETLSVGWVSDDFQLALAVAAMIVFLMQIRTLLSGPRNAPSRRPAWLAAGAGVAASWLHPWQGIMLLLILVMLVIWERPSLDRHKRLLVPALLTALPVAYYALLPTLDAGWAQSKQATAYSWTTYVPALLVTLGPIVLMMAPGYARPSDDAGDRMLKLWPLASLILFLTSPSDAMHAFGGVAVPTALLMVRGWPRVQRALPNRLRSAAGWLALSAIAFSVLAAPISVVHHLTQYRAGDQSFAEIARDDARALDWISSRPRPAYVLSGPKLGAWVPAVTDDYTWIGHPVWTPSYGQRYRLVTALFNGSMDGAPGRERAFVLSTGATIVLQPCGWHAQLARALTPAGFTARAFGCATLYSRAIG
jgi:hypothetical protein